MSRLRQHIATLAIGIALTVAASPLAKASPVPLNGVRTALELIARKPAAKPVSSPTNADASPVPHGTATACRP